MAEYYFIAINLISFLCYLLSMRLRAPREDGHVDTVLVGLALLGGSAGVLAALLIFNRKAAKDNIMSRVCFLCIFVLQVIAILVLTGHHADHVTWAFWTYFAEHPMLVIYLGAINVVTFAAFAVDKVNAVKERHRIKIVTLLGLAFAGGTVGALLGMYLLRHKTRKNYFAVGVPLILLTQAVVLLYAMNMG